MIDENENGKSELLQKLGRLLYLNIYRAHK